MVNPPINNLAAINHHYKSYRQYHEPIHFDEASEASIFIASAPLESQRRILRDVTDEAINAVGRKIKESKTALENIQNLWGPQSPGTETSGMIIPIVSHTGFSTTGNHWWCPFRGEKLRAAVKEDIEA